MNNDKRCWKQYNQSLIQRGSLTFWIEKDFLKSWKQKGLGRGRPKYTKWVIEAGLILRAVYRLTLRQLQGFFGSLITLLGYDEKCPDYTLFCKRAKECADRMQKLSNRRPTEIVIDSSGLKTFGEGEWKTYKHGRDKRRKWVKIHVGVDPQSGECITCEITDEKTADSKEFEPLIRKAPRSVKRAYADGAYDTKECRTLLVDSGIEGFIPPRKNARLSVDKKLEERNNAIREIRGLQGDLSLWKLLKGYGRRSLVETYFSRLKGLCGDRLRSMKFENQVAETLYRVHALNKMTHAQSVK